MKKSVFFDSWGWIAVADRKDPYHKIAESFYEEYLKQKGIPITTDYILDEVFCQSNHIKKGVKRKQKNTGSLNPDQTVRPGRRMVFLRRNRFCFCQLRLFLF